MSEKPLYITSAEQVGPFHVRQELEILPASVSDKPLGWTCQVFSGCEVFLASDPGTLIINKEGLKAGDKVTLWDGRWSGEVAEDEEDQDLFVRIGTHTIATLEFDQDSRHCWVSGAMFNTRGLKSLEVNK